MPTNLTGVVVKEVSVVDQGACRDGDNPLATAVLVKRDAVKKDDDAKGILRRLGQMLGLTSYGETAADGEPTDAADADMKALTFEAAYNAIEAREYAADMLSEVSEAVEALYRSVHSILDDETISDPEAAVRAQFDAFKTHAAKLVPEEMEKAAGKIAKAITAGSAGITPVNKGDTEVTDDLKKALADKDAQIAALAKSLEGRYTADEAAYVAKLDDVAKGKFAGMTPEERKAEMEKGELCKRADIPEDIRKQLAEHEDLKKRVAAMEADREFASFQKRAADLGLPGEAAKHLQVIAKASPEAAAFVEKLAGAVKAVEKASPLFKELGTDNGADATSAQAQLTAKAHEIAKRDNVTFAKAYTTACTEHPDLYRQQRAESAV